MTKVNVPKAALLTGYSQPTLYKHMDDGRLPFSLNQKNKKVIDIEVLRDKYGFDTEGLREILDLETEDTSAAIQQNQETLEHLNGHIKSLEDHVSTLQGQLEIANNRNDILLRVIDPNQYAPVDIFIAPLVDFFKQ